jgi:hypothetical protein
VAVLDEFPQPCGGLGVVFVVVVSQDLVPVLRRRGHGLPVSGVIMHFTILPLLVTGVPHSHSHSVKSCAIKLAG